MSIRYSRADFDEFFQLVMPSWRTLTNTVISTEDGSALECHLVILLTSAYLAGWTPAWTLPAKDFTGSTWTGGYFEEEQPIVQAHDALAIALALETALPDVMQADAAACVDSEYLYECFYGLWAGQRPDNGGFEEVSQISHHPKLPLAATALPSRIPERIHDLEPQLDDEPVFPDGPQEILDFITLCRKGAFYIEG